MLCIIENNLPNVEIEGKVDDIKIDKALRHTVWFNYIGTEMISNCFCCHGEVRFDTNYEAGHVTARSKGGPTTVANLRPVCRMCNRSMGTKDMKEYAISQGLKGRITHQS